jgi:plasmid stabilization system protein ParE
MTKLLLLPAALADMERAADWYGSKAAPLRAGFLADLESRMGHIRDFPRSAPIHRGRVRRLLLKTFPHGVYYVELEGLIKVLAVMHLKRDPRKAPLH